MPELSESDRTLLLGRHYAVLGTQNEDDSIHLTPVWYVYRDGRLCVGTSSSSRKFRNVSARPQASLVVDIRKPGAERWVSVSGPTEFVRGEVSRKINNEILRRYLTAQALDDPSVGPVFQAADDVTICIRPRKWRSWSGKDLDAQFFGGVLSATPEKWFLPVEE